MNNHVLLALTLLLTIFCLLSASEVKFGERSFINIYEVPDEAMEKGRLKIKLSEDYSELAANLEHRDKEIASFGIRELDELNIHFQVNKISKLFYMSGGNNKFSQRHREWGLHLWFELQFTSNEDVRDIVMSYRELKDIVQWAEPEYKKKLLSVESNSISAMENTLARWTPNDTYYPNQWHYHNTGQTGGTVDADIDLPEAWNIEKGHSDVVVAVIDQGIQTNHPDLAANMWVNPGEIAGNGIDDDANGYVDDIYGYNFAEGTGTISAGDHGCHTGGTIAAVTNNGTGVSGIAGGSGSGDGVRLMSCQVFSSYNGGFELAPVYAADNGAAISQNSWSYTSEGVYDQSVLDAIDYFNANAGGAVMGGGITIFAAGNDNSSGNWFPACYSGAFSVAATNHEDIRSYYSNYDSWVDVSAPGGETTNASAEGVLSCVTGSNYAYMQGTSMACPHASGVAALVVSYLHRAGSSITNTDLADLLRDTTDDHYDVNPSYIGQLGTGRINAHSALLAANPTLPSCNITAPTNGQVFDLNSTITVDVTATDSDGYITGVAFYIDEGTTPSYTDYSSPYSWNWDTTGISGGTHNIRVVATDNDSNTAEREVSVFLLAPPDEGFETGNFSSFPWESSGDGNWFVQSAETYSGSYAARSGAINDEQTSTMSLTLNITEAGEISFFQKVSSELNWDYLRFHIDGIQQDEWSGSGVWSNESYPVTSGSHTFSWTYEKDTSVSSGSDCAWVDHIIFPPYNLPSEYYPPQNLAATGANGVVYLIWDAPSYGTPTGYQIYKDGSLLTTVPDLSYDDYSVVNGTSYSYYLIAVYAGGVSDPTPIVSATPNLITSVVIGDGTDSNGSTNACPINVYYESLHGQSVYTAAELNAAGLFGPAEITEIGFNVTQTPDLAMPNYLVRMGHTTAENVSSWISASALSNVWTSASYQPTQTGWDMLTLSTPFTWNGTDNLVIDTAYGLIGEWDSSGTTQYTSINAGYRYIRNDYNDQTEVFSGGYTSSYRPNIKLNISVEPQDEPEIVVDPLSLDFGEVEVGQTSSQQFTIQNTGTASLTGSISTPNGYAVSEVAARENKSRIGSRSSGLRTTVSETRNTLAFTVGAGASESYDLTFAPSEVSYYNGNVVINSNDADESVVNIALTGSGYTAPVISIDNNTLAATLIMGGEATDSFTISNLGSQDLTFTLSESPAVDWFTFAPDSGTISGDGSQLITGSFSATGMNPGTYQTTLLIGSNDPSNPELTVNVEMEVVNTSPTIVLPAEGFEFDMNTSLVVDFTSYVDDPDAQTLVLDYSGNTNVLISIDALEVTFTATADWHGSEELTFSVYDGYDYAYDTATVTVNFVNTPPTIVLPAGGFEFDMNGSLTVDFSQYVDDADNDPLTLEYAGNTNVLVSIDELSVTFTATGNWFGTENLSFTASDGTDQSTDTAYITVNLNYLDIPQVTSITHTGSGTSIEWNAVTNANVYHIYRALEPFGSYEYLGSTSSLGYEDNQMFDMAFYQVRAVYEEPVAR